jgi:hypothetical protein
MTATPGITRAATGALELRLLAEAIAIYAAEAETGSTSTRRFRAWLQVRRLAARLRAAIEDWETP